MGLLSIFQRQTDNVAADTPAAEADAVAAARTRARRRLIGAAVLLAMGVVGFPLLFETQPRPVPVNIPIEIPRKETAPPLAPPGASPNVSPPGASPTVSPPGVVSALPAASAAAVLPDAEPPLAVAPVPAETVERADVPAHAVPPAAASKSVPARPAAPTSPPTSTPTPAADGARAQALLNGQPASAAAGRLVVQVGAYTEPAKLRDARQKVEKLGFKTYTQEVQVAGEKRTRVRVGPFANKAEADAAAARIKASGLPVAILTL